MFTSPFHYQQTKIIELSIQHMHVYPACNSGQVKIKMMLIYNHFKYFIFPPLEVCNRLTS